MLQTNQYLIASESVKPDCDFQQTTADKPPDINIGEVRRFLDLLDPNAERFLFTSFDDDKVRYKHRREALGTVGNLSKKLEKLKAATPVDMEQVRLLEGQSRTLWKTAPGFDAEYRLTTLEGATGWIAARQKIGCNACCCVQAMNGARRLKKEYAYGRAIFAEMDQEPKRPWSIPPSISNETSSGKFHQYWLIDEASGKVAPDIIERINQHIVDEYGADPNAKDIARTLRLPGTWNLKPGRDPWQVRITDAPGYRYHIDELVEAFPPIEKPKPKRGPAPQWSKFQTKDQRLRDLQEKMDHIPADHREEWLHVGFALHAETGGSSDGLRMWDAWSATTGADNYVRGECDFQWGRFRADGGITAGKIDHLAKANGWQPPKTKTKRKADEKRQQSDKSDHQPAQVIKLRAGELHEATEAAMQSLDRLGVDIFQRGSKLVRPIKSPGVDSKGRVVNTAQLYEIDKVYMRKLLCQHITWFKWDERKKEDANGEKWKRIDPPEEIAKMILASAGQWPFRTISGIISTPTMRFDGSILSNAGYDARTQLFLESPLGLPAMPDNPSKADAEAALKILDDLLHEFPFVDKPSRSVALSAMLSAVARGMFDVVPAHGATAPTPGTGKSYLFDIVAAILLGERCPVINVSSDSEGETEKRIIGMAISGQQIIHLDNVNGLLSGDALCQLIERPTCNLRPLGKSDIVKVENRSLIFFNGNNCRVQGDMTRRVLVAGLDARMERPAEREFNGDPVATVLADRGKYIAACMTILRAYLKAGKPKVCKVPMNSFGEWSDSVRSALVWLGMADPCDTIETAREGDPDLQKVASFCAAAQPVIGGDHYKARTVADLIKVAQDGDYCGGDYQHRHPELTAFMEDFKDRGEVNKKRLGNWLAKFTGRVVDGLCIQAHFDRGKKINRWFVECVDRQETEQC